MSNFDVDFNGHGEVDVTRKQTLSGLHLELRPVPSFLLTLRRERDLSPRTSSTRIRYNL